MKKIILAILIITCSIIGFSQDASDLAIGNWSFLNETTLTDSMVESSIKQFDIRLSADSSFTIKENEKLIKGKWFIKDSTLNLTGTMVGSTTTKQYDLPIYYISNNKISFLLEGGYRRALMNLIRKE